MGVEVFSNPQEYKEWAKDKDRSEVNISVKHVTVWHNQILVTWEYV